MRLLLLITVSIIFLTGALGLKTVEQCNLDPEMDRDAERMNCYHTAAITYAYLGDETTAGETCLQIWQVFGAGAPDTQGDIVTKAEMKSNLCYYDVAMILRDSSYCSNIQARRTSAVNTNLLGEAVSQERCFREADRLAEIAPEHYNQPGQDNLCSVIFVLPFLLLAAFVKRP